MGSIQNFIPDRMGPFLNRFFKFQRLTPYAAGPSISELVTLFEARLRGAMFWGRFLFRTFYCEFGESVGGFGVFGGAS